MRYDNQALDELTSKYAEVDDIYRRLVNRLQLLLRNIRDRKAQEYLLHGVARRLSILTRCIHNIFRIFPVDRRKLLTSKELTDVDINLHAFTVNVTGLLDNLAWVFAYENDLVGDPKEEKLGKKDIGLFNDRTKSFLPANLKAYLETQPIKDWYSDHSKNYRDALAHRIPLYVPPFTIDNKHEQKYFELEAKKKSLDFTIESNFLLHDQLHATQRGLGKPSLIFTHSFDEGSEPRVLHAQMIIDYLTIEEIIYSFANNIKS